MKYENNRKQYLFLFVLFLQWARMNVRYNINHWRLGHDDDAFVLTV